MIEHWMMKKNPALFVGGGLSERRREGFEIHLNRCSRCREAVRELTHLTERLKADSVPSPTPDVWKGFSSRLHRVLEAEKEEGKGRLSPSPGVSFSAPRSMWILPVGAAAVFLVLFSAALLIKGSVPRGTISEWALTDEETLVAELAGIENDILEEAIGLMFPVQEGWLGLLTDVGDEDIEEINVSVNTSEEEFWDEPDLLEEVIEEVLS